MMTGSKMNVTEIQAVFIDMDGTLADGLDLLYRSYMNLLAAHGYQGSKAEFEELTGPKTDEILHILNKRYQLTTDTSSLLREYYKTLRVTYINSVPLFPGSEAFLTFAKKKGYKLALVTSADKELAHLFLKNHQIDHYFDAVVTPEGNIRGKPSPDIYENALEVLNVSPNSVVAIEDSFNGVQSARGAGIMTLHLMHYPDQKAFDFQEQYHPVYSWPDVKALFE